VTGRAIASVLAEVVRVDGIRGLDIHTHGGTGGERWARARDAAQEEYDAAERAGVPTFALALREELYEALAETEPALLRAELVQVAAVCVRWIRAIDRATLPAMTCDPYPLAKALDATCEALAVLDPDLAAKLCETPTVLPDVLAFVGVRVMNGDEKARAALTYACALYAAITGATVADLPPVPPPPPPDKW